MGRAAHQSKIFKLTLIRTKLINEWVHPYELMNFT